MKDTFTEFKDSLDAPAWMRIGTAVLIAVLICSIIILATTTRKGGYDIQIQELGDNVTEAFDAAAVAVALGNSNKVSIDAVTGQLTTVSDTATTNQNGLSVLVSRMNANDDRAVDMETLINLFSVNLTALSANWTDTTDGLSADITTVNANLTARIGDLTGNVNIFSANLTSSINMTNTNVANLSANLTNRMDCLSDNLTCVTANLTAGLNNTNAKITAVEDSLEDLMSPPEVYLTGVFGNYTAQAKVDDAGNYTINVYLMYSAPVSVGNATTYDGAISAFYGGINWTDASVPNYTPTLTYNSTSWGVSWVMFNTGVHELAANNETAIPIVFGGLSVNYTADFAYADIYKVVG